MIIVVVIHIPKMDCDDVVPILLRHRPKGFISKNTSVGNEDVNTTESIQRDLDDCFAIFSGADGSSGLPASFIMTV